MNKSEVESVSTHIQRSFWNVGRAPESEGAVALETGILVATLHHLVASPRLRVAMETLRLLLMLLESSTMGSGVQTARYRHLRGNETRREGRGKKKETRE